MIQTIILAEKSGPPPDADLKIIHRNHRAGLQIIRALVQNILKHLLNSSARATLSTRIRISNLAVRLAVRPAGRANKTARRIFPAPFLFEFVAGIISARNTCWCIP
jgi:hypothetical protein